MAQQDHDPGPGLGLGRIIEGGTEGLQGPVDGLEAGVHLRRQGFCGVGFRDQPVILLGQGRDLGGLGRAARRLHRIDAGEVMDRRMVGADLGPCPALPLANVLGEGRQLFGDERVQQGRVLQPAAAVLGEQVAQHRPARRLIGLEAHEHGAPVPGRNLGLGHGPADGVGGGVGSDLGQHLPLPVPVLADAEGGQLVQGQRPLPVGGHQLRRRRPQPQPLAHDLGGDPEPRPDLLGAVALLLGEAFEGLELVGGMHGLAGDVFIEADLMGVIVGVHDDPDRMGPLDRLALDQHAQRLPPPFADADEVGAGRGALPVPFDLHHGRLQHPLGPDRRRQRLQRRRRMPHLAGVARRSLEPVQRHGDLRPVHRLLNRLHSGGVSRRRNGGVSGLSLHVCLLGSGFAGARRA